MKKSEEDHFRVGALPQTPRFNAFAPGFLDREASCARAPGIPAPESALGLRLRRALPSAQVRSVYQGCKVRKNFSRLHKMLDTSLARKTRGSDGCVMGASIRHLNQFLPSKGISHSSLHFGNPFRRQLRNLRG